MRHGNAPPNTPSWLREVTTHANCPSSRQGPTNQVFYSNPSLWATNLGFNTPTIARWAQTCNTYHEVGSHQCTDPLSGYPQQAIYPTVWKNLSEQERSTIIAARVQMARKAMKVCLQLYCKKFHVARKEALRNHGIAGWARLIRPTSRKSHGYSATWCKPMTENEGDQRRPRKLASALHRNLQNL